MEKKAYIIPALKTLSVNEEQLLLTVSISDGTNNIDDLTDGGDGDAGNEGLAKPYTVWD